MSTAPVDARAWAASISPAVLEVFSTAAEVLRPPPRVSISQWAEQNIVLSTEDSGEPGAYRVARAPYQRRMQDVVLDPRVRRIVFWTGAQLGKTRVDLNVAGYFAREDPCGILWMAPTIDLAKRISRQRIAPMFRDSAALRGLLVEGAKKAGGAVLEKSFPGGMLFLVGANSPAALSSMPMRIIISDETDRYPESAGAEGDPISLAEERQTQFWNARSILSSTCTIKGGSRIEAAYEISDREKWWMPCPHCGTVQVLKWDRLTFPAEPEELTVDNVVYACGYVDADGKPHGCGAALTELDKPWMLANAEKLGGGWRAERPEIRDVAGFWLNSLNSPFITWAGLARKWREANAHRENPQLLKTFINLSLAETWEEQVEEIDGTDLLKRREDYPPPALPSGICVLTAGVDVQADRLELEVVGWGPGEESWSVDVLTFEGDTSSMQSRVIEGVEVPGVWEQFAAWLHKARYLHARGIRLEIACTLVDARFHSNIVYAFTKKMQGASLRVFAEHGIHGFGKPPLGKRNKNNRANVLQYPVGVDVIKESIYQRLRLATAGPGYMHFSRGMHPGRDGVVNDAEYFRQLTVEKIKRKYVNGFPTRYWYKPDGARNEALDRRVYATAALYSLSSNCAEMLEMLAKDLRDRARDAFALRRAKVLPGQLPLLDATVDEPAAQTSAKPPDGFVKAIEGAVVNTEGVPPSAEDVSENEYKVAEVLDQGGDDPEPKAAPKVKIRKSWL